MKEALQTYKKAFNLDETSVPALAGIIHLSDSGGPARGSRATAEGGTELHWQAGQPPLPHCSLGTHEGTAPWWCHEGAGGSGGCPILVPC